MAVVAEISIATIVACQALQCTHRNAVVRRNNMVGVVADINSRRFVARHSRQPATGTTGNKAAAAAASVGAVAQRRALARDRDLLSKRGSDAIVHRRRPRHHHRRRRHLPQVADDSTADGAAAASEPVDVASSRLRIPTNDFSMNRHTTSASVRSI